MSFALEVRDPKQLEPRLRAAMQDVTDFALRFAAASDAVIAEYLQRTKVTTIATAGDPW
jgi:hypothetical protein